MKDVVIFILSILLILGFMADSYMVLYGQIKATDPNMLLLIGNISGGWQSLAIGVSAYWFGTTKSSADKDKIIANTTKGENQ